MNIVEKLHKEFLTEASSSPILLNDLAAMEKYIAESYMGRSLIELLQNADDAYATKFCISKLKNNTYLIANNGREFTEEDLYALCRSGASTKRRKSGTIGFRGIGFKSVVNYAKTVHLISGNIRTTFSRDQTKKEITNIEKVPLIRIPHFFSGDNYNKIVQQVLENGYTTAFVFETENDLLESEIQEFNISCMIFLRNLSEIFYKNDSMKLWKTEKKKKSDISEIITCFDGKEKTTWLVYSNEKKKPCDIAFRYDMDKVVPASKEESVMHSFMPTKNRLSIPIKINGDFSTDPSRTKVTIDDETMNAINNCGTFLSEIAINIIDSGKDEFGIIKTMSTGSIDPLSNIRGKSASDYFVECVHENLKKYFQNIAHGKDIYYQRNGITNNDFDIIINTINAVGIGNKIEKEISGITELVRIIGIKQIPIDRTLEVMKTIECEKATRIQILSDVVQDSRFGIKQDIKEKIKKAKLIEYSNGVKSIEEQEQNDFMEESYQGAVVEKLGTFSGLEWFAKQMNIAIKDNNFKQEVKELELNNTVFTNHIIKKWRSVEENFLQFIQNLPEVDTAIDVANKNLGYDMEVTLKSGEHEYYEIKSVNRIGDTFSMTNNEFSSAIQHKEKYKLAVVQQEKSQFNVCIISDPANSLILTKRVTRWEWYCSDYSGSIFRARMES